MHIGLGEKIIKIRHYRLLADLICLKIHFVRVLTQCYFILASRKSLINMFSNRCFRVAVNIYF